MREALRNFYQFVRNNQQEELFDTSSICHETLQIQVENILDGSKIDQNTSCFVCVSYYVSCFLVFSPMRHNAHDLIASLDQPKKDLLNLLSLYCCFNSIFFVTYNLRRTTMAVCVSGCFSTLFSKAKRACVSFVCVCMLGSL